jgi:ribosomal protein L37AE/L43A
MEIWKCPKCGKEWEINNHYLKILEMQKFLTYVSTHGEKEIKYMCMSCEYCE